MFFKIDVQTQVNDSELTSENCLEIIAILQESYKNVRKEMYEYFLGLKTLKKSIIFAVILLGLYFLSENMFFIYFMPISVLLSMIGSIISAEYISSQMRKQIQDQLKIYKQKRDSLLKTQKLKV